MKIGMLIHSDTGNTLSVAERLRERFLAEGHSVEIKPIKAVSNGKKTIILAEIPDIRPYDFVVIGAPVHGYSLSPLMSTCLAQLKDLTEKKVACFVTEHFPKPWMGGSNAIKQMIRSVHQKGAEVSSTGIINWSSKAREEQINELLSRF